MKINFCEFFAAIEANPKAMISGLTIRDYMEAAAHLEECADCNARSERILAKYPDNGVTPGWN